MSEIPLSRRYSQLYIEKGAPTADSKRFRARLGYWMADNAVHFEYLAIRVRRELGVYVPILGERTHWERFVSTCEIRDVLDLITLAVEALETRDTRTAATFRAFVERAMREENLSLTIDEDGVIHPYVDAEFQQARRSAVAALGEAQHRAALAHYEHGMRGLILGDTLTAVRGVFDASEAIFKQATGEPRLGSGELTKHLKPRAKAYYPDRAADAAGLLVTAYGSWVNACHQYRHADDAPEPTPPPFEIAVALMSTGSAFIRWMAETNFLQR